MASPWGMQEIGARGLREDARAGGSDGRKVTSAAADEGETQGHHEARWEQRGEKRRQVGMGGSRILGSGGKLCRPRGLRSGPRSPQSGRGEGGPRGLRRGGKPREGPPRGGGGGSNCLRTTRPAMERAGGSNHTRTTQPPTEGARESSHGRMTQLQKKTEGELSCHGTTRPPDKMRDPGETKPWEPPQRPDTNWGRTDGGGGEGTKTHPPPKKPGSNRPMAETVQRNEAQQGRRTRRWRRRREPAAQGTRLYTSPTQP